MKSKKMKQITKRLLLCFLKNDMTTASKLSSLKRTSFSVLWFESRTSINKIGLRHSLLNKPLFSFSPKKKNIFRREKREGKREGMGRKGKWREK